MGKEKMDMDALHDLTKEFREFLYKSEW